MIKIVFFGTPEFAVASLDRLIADGLDIAAVVTAPDKPAGRGHKMLQSDVKRYALEHNLRILQPERLKSEEFLSELHSINADLFVVIAFRMLPEEVWAMPRLGTFNLHASLLPNYRGAAPINRAVMAGETKTGVTTFFLKHEIDTGDIIEQRETDIGPDECVGDVHDRLMTIGADMVSHTVKEIEMGTVKTTPQPQGEFTPAPKIFSEDCKIDWNRSNCEVHNHVRGLSPYPLAWSDMEDNSGRIIKLKILKTKLTDIKAIPGNIVTNHGRFIVGCGEGSVEILEVLPAGKKKMDADAFLRGYSPVRFQ